MLEYFPPFDSPECHYTFIDKKSTELVVTVGASWTGDIYQPTDYTSDMGISLKDYKLKNLYGYLIAEQLQADFLNLAVSGSSNFSAADRILKLLGVIDSLPYKKVYLIWTSTDPGRGFNSHEDLDIDYESIITKITNTGMSFDYLLEQMNQHALSKVLPQIHANKKIVFRLATDGIDYIGLDNAGDSLMPTPWLFTMPGIKQSENKCYIHDRAAIDRLLTANNDFTFTSTGKLQYKTWIMDQIDKLTQRRDFADNNPVVRQFFTNFHPNETANQLWADFILSTL